MREISTLLYSKTQQYVRSMSKKDFKSFKASKLPLVACCENYSRSPSSHHCVTVQLYSNFQQHPEIECIVNPAAVGLGLINMLLEEIIQPSYDGRFRQPGIIRCSGMLCDAVLARVVDRPHRLRLIIPDKSMHLFRDEMEAPYNQQWQDCADLEENEKRRRNGMDQQTRPDEIHQH